MPLILIAWPVMIFVNVVMCFMAWLIEGNIDEFFKKELEISIRFPLYIYNKVISKRKAPHV